MFRECLAGSALFCSVALCILIVLDVSMITADRLQLPKLDGIYFVSPTDENIRQIAKDFEFADDPMYNHIHLFFTSSTIYQLIKLFLIVVTIVRD